VVPKQGAELDANRLSEHAGEALSAYKRPKRIILRAEPIPKSPVHKPLRRKLRDEYVPVA